MDEKELAKIEELKIDIKKYIDKIYNTTSLIQEANATEEIIKLIKKFDKDSLLDFANESDLFAKCILYYKLPIEYRINVEFINTVRVEEGDRLIYWKDYKIKLKEQKLNIEEEYNKLIMMACILHVPIEDDKIEEELQKLKEEVEKQVAESNMNSDKEKNNNEEK